MDKKEWEKHLKDLRKKRLSKKKQMQKIHKHKSVLKKGIEKSKE